MRWHKLRGGCTVPGETALFLFLSDRTMSVGRYDVEKGGWVTDDERTKAATVTHWAYIKRPPHRFKNKMLRAWLKARREIGIAYYAVMAAWWGALASAFKCAAGMESEEYDEHS